MKLSRRAPRRCYSLRWHGGRVIVYRATLEAVRASWRRGEVDIVAMDAAADAALERLVKLREMLPAEYHRRWTFGEVAGVK